MWASRLNAYFPTPVSAPKSHPILPSLNQPSNKRGWNAQLLLPALVLLVAVLLAAGLIVTGKPVQPSEPEPQAVAIKTVEAQPQTVQLLVTSQGTIEPRTQSDLIPEVSGTVVSMSLALVAGGEFKKNEPLLSIDTADYETALARSKAALARAESQQKRAKREYQRLRKISTQKLASEAQLENAESDYAVALANLEEARANRQQAQRNLGRTTIRAPYDGRVLSEAVDVGQFVSRGKTIATVYATDYVEARLPIADSQLAFLNLRNRQDDDKPIVTLSSRYAGKQLNWLGEVTRTEAAIDVKSRMLYAVVRVTPEHNDGRVPLVGQFVKAEIQGKSVTGVYRLPRAALRDNAKVLIVADDNTLESRDVNIVRFQRDEVLVDSGLRAGDQVSVSRRQTLAAGTRVTPIETDDPS